MTSLMDALQTVFWYIPDFSYVSRDHWSTEVIDFRHETAPFSAAGLILECHDVTVQANGANTISSLLHLDQCRRYT